MTQDEKHVANETHNDGLANGTQPSPWLDNYPEHVSWHNQFVPQSLPDMFDEAVRTNAHKPCTHFLGKSLTYREIGELTEKTAIGLQKLGVTNGTCVGLLLPNTPTFIIFYFAILKAGGTVVNYNPLYTTEELTHQIKDSGTKIMVTLDLSLLFDKADQILSAGHLEKTIVSSFTDLLPGYKSILFKLFKSGERANPRASSNADKIIYHEDLLRSEGQLEPVNIDPETTVAVLQYTGGTTGVPKGAMLTHANLSINQQQIESWRGEGVSDIGKIMAILPFFHVFAMTTVMNFGLSIGAEIIMMPKFELVSALKLIHATKPNCLPGVPTLYAAMINHPNLTKYDLSSLKFCISGGAPLPIEVKRDFERLTGCDLVEGYGLSETSPVATCNPTDDRVKEGSIGMPFPATTISIRSLEDRNVEVPLGEKGEICIAGPQVMKGYWNKPEETANAFVGRFFRTGDVGYMDDEGFIFIVDRIKDLIICSGFNVYPRRIEDAIYQNPKVAEVTVIGIPDDYRGEAPKAFVKLKDGEHLSADEMMEFLEPKLSKIEMPAEIEFRDELPKTMVGKLSKKELRQAETAA